MDVAQVESEAWGFHVPASHGALDCNEGTVLDFTRLVRIPGPVSTAAQSMPC